MVYFAVRATRNRTTKGELRLSNQEITGKVVAVSVSGKRTDPKSPQAEIQLRAGYGVEDDSHAGLSQREVSLLGIEAVEELNRASGIEAGPGAFAENITTRGVDLVSLPIGARLTIGDAVLELVEIGKPPDAAHTYSFKGHTLLPTKGIFCRVLRDGRVVPGQAIMVDVSGTS